MHFSKHFCRFYSKSCVLDTSELCTADIHDILWKSIDLKTHMKNNQKLGKTLKDKRVTMLCGSQSKCVNLIVQSAMKALGADLRLMLGASRWEKSHFKKDVGKFYSLYSDMIIAQGKNHGSICELSDGASVPVVNIESHKFAPLHGLAVLMTLQEHFNSLSGLTMGWVGPMGSRLNTLIYLLPKVGINLKYNSSPTPHFPSSPLLLPAGQTLCENFHTTIEGCADPKQTIKGVDVVGTSKHKNETIVIDLDMVEVANPDWVFLHLLPRWEEDVTDEVFNHKNSLVWPLHENIQYITMAVALNILSEYKPIIPKPNFYSSSQ